MSSRGFDPPPLPDPEPEGEPDTIDDEYAQDDAPDWPRAEDA